MKIYRIIIFALLLIYSSRVVAQGYANLSFLDKRICDIGTVAAKDTVLVKRFYFTNNGEDTLRISKIYKSCSCTKTVLSNKIVMPNNKGYIDVFIDTKNKVGFQEVVIHLIANTVIKDHVIRIIFNITEY